MGLWRCNARAVCDEQVHHRVTGDIDGGCRHHVAKGDGAAGSHIRGDGARGALVVAVGAHVPLELGGRLAVDAAQVADEYAARSCAAKAPRTVLPLLAVVLLGMDAKVRQCGEAAVTEMAGVVLRLVVHPHVICDVSSRQELPTDVAGHLLLVANHMRTQTILGGKAGLTSGAFEGSL